MDPGDEELIKSVAAAAATAEKAAHTLQSLADTIERAPTVDNTESKSHEVSENSASSVSPDPSSSSASSASIHTTQESSSPQTYSIAEFVPKLPPGYLENVKYEQLKHIELKKKWIKKKWFENRSWQILRKRYNDPKTQAASEKTQQGTGTSETPNGDDKGELYDGGLWSWAGSPASTATTTLINELVNSKQVRYCHKCGDHPHVQPPLLDQVRLLKSLSSSQISRLKEIMNIFKAEQEENGMNDHTLCWAEWSRSLDIAMAGGGEDGDDVIGKGDDL